MATRRATLLWWTAVAVLAAALLLRAGVEVDRGWLERPETPFDNTRADRAAQWRFLTAASAHVTEGSTFTVRAVSRHQEMRLYMMALGAVPHAHGRPSSYYGRATERAAEEVRFVLCFPTSAAQGEEGRRVARVAGGWVLERSDHEDSNRTGGSQ